MKSMLGDCRERTQFCHRLFAEVRLCSIAGSVDSRLWVIRSQAIHTTSPQLCMDAFSIQVFESMQITQEGFDYQANAGTAHRECSQRIDAEDTPPNVPLLQSLQSCLLTLADSTQVENERSSICKKRLRLERASFAR